MPIFFYLALIGINNNKDEVPGAIIIDPNATDDTINRFHV